MEQDERVCVMTAAMCEGNKLGDIRNDFPDRFFDTGICEGHAVAFAGGMAKSGMRPIVDIYSTFLQRSFDQIFQEVALQNLPVVFCLDRAGLTGPDGPTHHGTFDNTYMRTFPNIVVMAPGDEADVAPMLDFALKSNSPSSIRYPKENAVRVDRPEQPIELGRAEVQHWGQDGNFVVFGTLFPACVEASERLREEGYDVGVINARVPAAARHRDNPAGRGRNRFRHHRRGKHPQRWIWFGSARSGQRCRPVGTESPAAWHSGPVH